MLNGNIEIGIRKFLEAPLTLPVPRILKRLYPEIDSLCPSNKRKYETQIISMVQMPRPPLPAPIVLFV